MWSPIGRLGNSKRKNVDTLGRQAASFRYTKPLPSNNITLLAVTNLLKNILIISSSHSVIKQQTDMETTKNTKHGLDRTSRTCRNRNCHCKLQKHHFKMKLVHTSLCRECEQEDETVEHVFCDHSAFFQIRGPMFGEYWQKLLRNFATSLKVVGLMTT